MVAFKRVNIDGTEYVPLSTVHLAAPPESKEAVALIAAAIGMVRAAEDVDGDQGEVRLDRATTKFKRAVSAFERRAAQRD